MPTEGATCRSCGRTIRSGTTYCVPCATRQSDSDAAVFDRWLAILFSGAGIAAAALAAYIAARYFDILA